MLTAEDIRKKIAELEQQRDQFIAQANQQIGALMGQIAAWKEILARLEEADGRDATSGA